MVAMRDCDSQARIKLQEHLVRLNLPQEVIDELMDRFTLVTYFAGAPIIRHGSPADLLFCLVSGLAKVYKPGNEGERVLVRIAAPGEFLGQADFVNMRGRRCQLFEVFAAVRCDVAIFTREQAFKVAQKLDKLALLQFVESLNTYWSELTHWYVTLLGLPFQRRLELVLSELASRFGIPDKRGVFITPELSQSDLAEMIGSSRPMISRLMKDMTESGEITRVGKHYIIAADAPWLSMRNGLSSKVPADKAESGVLSAANGYRGETEEGRSLR